MRRDNDGLVEPGQSVDVGILSVRNTSGSGLSTCVPVDLPDSAMAGDFEEIIRMLPNQCSPHKSQAFGLSTSIFPND